MFGYQHGNTSTKYAISSNGITIWGSLRGLFWLRKENQMTSQSANAASGLHFYRDTCGKSFKGFVLSS